MIDANAVDRWKALFVKASNRFLLEEHCECGRGVAVMKDDNQDWYVIAACVSPTCGAYARYSTYGIGDMSTVLVTRDANRNRRAVERRLMDEWSRAGAAMRESRIAAWRRERDRGLPAIDSHNLGTVDIDATWTGV